MYGDCSQFQFDYLRDTYSDLGTRAERKCSFALVDEVDAMFIDDSSKLARLSSTLPGMDLLQIFYHLVWDRLSLIKTHIFQFLGNIYYLEGKVIPDGAGGMGYAFAKEDTQQMCKIPNILAYIASGEDLEAARIYPVENVEEFIVDHLEKYVFHLIEENNNDANGMVKLPKHLKEFASSQISRWVESALTAEAFQENVHYIVDDGQVKPVDFNTTGVVQASTNWNNGLHQFIQIKHGLKLGSESVTTNFLSNLAMFQKYGENVVGFTGTLGSQTGKKVLSEVYQVDLKIIPEIHFKRYVRFPDFVAGDEAEWIKEVVITTLQETAKRRGVLIICETIKKAEIISATLEKLKQKVKLYTKNAENQEKQIERIHPGDVVVATNLAGRGTDIKTADIEEYGGLHVCLTFLPGSLRVEEQAFGRTSRQGKRGTGQLIIIGQGSAIELVEERDEQERNLLINFQNEELPLIQTKDTLFHKFSQIFQKFRKDFREKNDSYYKQTMDLIKSKLSKIVHVGHVTPTPVEVIVLSAVEERWAMFLRKFDAGEISTKEIQSKFIEFENQLSKDWNNNRVIQNGSNLFYLIQLGNYEFSQDSKFNNSLEQANSYFESAFEMDKEFAAGAIVGRGYTLLKGRVNLIAPDSHKSGYKEDALKLLQNSLPLLHQEMAMITVIQSLVERQSLPDPSSIMSQLTERSNLLGSFIRNVNSTISVIEKSLRRIHVTGKTGEDESTHLIPEHVIQSGRNIEWEEYDRYDLEFNDLTWRQDSGMTFDQAVSTISDSLSEKAKRKLKLFKSKFVGKKTPNIDDCSIRLTCPQADIGEIIKSGEILKQKSDFNIEIFDVSYGGKLGFEFDKVLSSKPPCKYSLEILFDSWKAWEHVLGLVDSEEWLKFKIEVNWKTDVRTKFKRILSSESGRRHSQILELAGILAVDTSDPDEAEADSASDSELDLDTEEEETSTDVILEKSLSVSSVIRPNLSALLGIGSSLVSAATEGPVDDKHQIFITPAAQTTIFGKSIKFNGLKSPGQVNKILKMLNYEKNLKSKSTTINLTLQAVQKKFEVINVLWEYLKEAFEKLTLHISNLDRGGASKVIPLLRANRVEFILHVQNMTEQTASFLLQKADVDQEEILQAEMKELAQLYMADRLPLAELRDLSARGICLIVTYNERKFVPWVSVAGLVALAALQTAAGGALICTGFGATVGMGLITEGMSDLVAAQRVYSTREFSWAGYGTQKAVSLTISAVSMGLNNLKDAAKGGKMIIQGAVSQQVQGAGGMVLINGKTVNAVIEIAGGNFKSLAYKQIVVSTVETGARIGLKYLGDSLAGFCFDQVRDGIVKNISGQVENHFYNKEFIKLISYYSTATDHNRLSYKVREVLDVTMNPKATGWLNLWSSVGAPLINGILSSPQFLGSTYQRVTMMVGIISGTHEIATVVKRVCTEIMTRLDEDKPKLSVILQSKCGLSKTLAEQLADKLSFKSGNSFELDDIPKGILTSEQKSKLKEVFKQLDKVQKGFNMNNSAMSQLMKSVVDSITNHIIKIANSHLVSPIIAGTAGTIVAKISAELQDRFLVSFDQNTDEQNKIAEKVEELNGKRKEERTAEENLFLEKYDRPNTFASQINYNAKDYTVAWQKREICAKAMEIRDKDQSSRFGQNSGTRTQALNILQGAPADMAILVSIAAQNGIADKIKIVDDPNYQPTQDDIEKGLNIIIYEKPGQGSQVGHYTLKSPTGETIEIKSDDMDCGYAVMCYLTGKTVDELRVNMSGTVLDNPDQFGEILELGKWMEDRYPDQASTMLMVGGRQSRNENFTPEDLNRRKNETCQEREERPEVQERIREGATPNDRPGYLYILKVVGTDGNIQYKIGRAENVEERVRQMERSNGETYEVMHSVETPNHRSGESIAHVMLDEFRVIPASTDTRDGRTEYFEGDLRLFRPVVDRAAGITSADSYNTSRRNTQDLSGMNNTNTNASPSDDSDYFDVEYGQGGFSLNFDKLAKWGEK